MLRIDIGKSRKVAIRRRKRVVHAAFARPSGDAGVVLQSWRDAWKTMELQDVKADIDLAVRAMRENPNEENENRLEAIRESRKSGDV